MDERCSLQKKVDSVQPNSRRRGAIEFAVNGDLRFLSHREMLRLLARACARARLPVRHTEGFNPHPRISLPLPRPVGIASDVELAVIEFSEPITPEAFTSGLAGQMPAGITILRGRMLDPKEHCHPRLVRYRVTTNGVDRDLLESKAVCMMGSEAIRYERFVHKHSKHVQIDLRPYIESVEVADGRVDFSLLVTGSGSARPAEICDLLGIGEQNINHLIRRLDIEWQDSQPSTAS